MSAVSILLENLTKVFRNPGKGEAVTAVNNLNLELSAGEMTALIGPSGCGKTTVLRMISGLETPTSGRVLFGGRDVTSLPPERRNVGLVFQGYALFPHLSVRGNVGYGLEVTRRASGLGDREIRSRVDAVLDLMRIGPLAERMPGQLSGGQQQRVALARAVVMEPAVLLFDEPLSNLDANLREYMRDELRRIQQETGVAGLYVTHDNSEAMAIAERVVVMRNGCMEQSGSPREVYEKPANKFVAGFMGPASFVGAVATNTGDGRIRVSLLGGLVSMDSMDSMDSGDSGEEAEDSPVGAVEAICMIRPEALYLDRAGSFQGRVARSAYLGRAMRYDIEIAGETIRLLDDRYGMNGVFAPGDSVRLGLRTELLRLLSGGRTTGNADAPPKSFLEKRRDC